MKVALVHYWLLHMRGGEKVLEAIAELYPEADIFTHIVNPPGLSESLRKHKITTTFISRLPLANKLYQAYLPFMPWALESLDLRSYDLVISIESGPAKGILPRPDATHITYCCSPMRYVWDMAPDYQASAGFAKRSILKTCIPFLRAWDRNTADRVDDFVSVSKFVSDRIYSFYRRESTVIYPPVETGDFVPAETPENKAYLLLGQLVSYKRADLAVSAFSKMGKRLIVVGEGEQMPLLKKIAGPTIELRGRLPFAQIKQLYQNCKALVFPGAEDFGIVPLEAQASGRPVIAFRQGGALETVVENQTGVFFDHQTEDSLISAVLEFEKSFKINPLQNRANALGFAPEIFKAKFRQHADAVIEKKSQKAYCRHL